MDLTENNKNRISVMQTITFTISDEEYAQMEDIVESPTEWARLAVVGRAHKAKVARDRTWAPKLRAEGVAIPATDRELQALILAHPEYKNRKQRNDAIRVSNPDGLSPQV